MNILPVVFRPEAISDIEDAFLYVLEKSYDHQTAVNYTNRVLERCDRIGNVPNGGTLRNDLGSNIRLVPFEKSAVILYQVGVQYVEITNVFFGRRDYEALLKSRK